MESIRVSAKTLDDAITKACIELGAASEALGYDILETGSRGVLGIGARPYVLRAWKKEEAPEEEQSGTKAALTEEAAHPEKKAEHKEVFAAAAENNKTEQPARGKEQEKKTKPVPAANEKPIQTKAKREPVREKEAAADRAAENAERGEMNPLSEERKKEVLEKAAAFLRTVFDGMGIQVEINAAWETGGSELSLNLSGDDMGVLIGKRGQTLDALQYLTSQVVNKHQNDYVRIKLDTENYRERRRETLETLARNIAYKVRRTKRPVALEPMNPYERRIIHSVLQAEKDITTRSEGEEPYRHVVIYCVRKKR